LYNITSPISNFNHIMAHHNCVFVCINLTGTQVWQWRNI